MKTIVNKSGMPLRVPLPLGKVLHLGPGKTGQIADGAAEHAGLRKLIEAGSIELQGDGDSDNPGGDGGAGPAGGHPESTQGRGKAKVPRRGGQRGA